MGADPQNVDSTQSAVVDDNSLTAVTPAQRESWYKLVSVGYGWFVSVSGFLVGGTLGGGLSFGQGVTAIVVGNGILAVVGVLIGLIGYRTGLTTYLVSRAVFGRIGSIIVSIVLGILAMGFIGVLIDAFANAFVALVPGVPWAAVVVVFAIAVATTAIFGYQGLAWLSRIAAPALIVLAAMALFVLGTAEGGFSAATTATPTDPISLDVGITAVVATWITGAALLCDITRYAPSASAVVVAIITGFVAGAGFFEFVAMISSHAVGSHDFIVAMSGLGLLLPAVLVLVLALWTTTDNNIYSASLAFTNASKLIGKTVAKPIWVILCTLIAIAVATLGFASDFLSFLNIIATVTPPFAGVVISHFWFLGYIRRLDEVRAESIPLRWEAIISWVGASMVAHFAELPSTPVVAMLIAGAAYVILSLISNRRATTAPAGPKV